MNKKVYSLIGETVYESVLPNGLTVRVAEKKGFLKSQAMLAVNYGGADRRFSLDGTWHDTPAGVAHFLEHKMFDMPDGSNALAALSARGAQANAFTSADMTAYYFSCTDGFYDNLRSLISFVTTPYFTAESVQKEQGIIAQEIAMGADRPSTLLYYGLLECLYRSHPIRDKVTGSAESIAQITPETLYACHRAFYRPCNMVLCCVGDVDPERIGDIAAELTDPVLSEQPRSDYGEPEPPEVNAPRFSCTAAVSAPDFYFGCKLPCPADGTEAVRSRLIGSLAMDYLAGEASPFFTSLYAQGLLKRDFGFGLSSAAGTSFVLLGGETRDPESVLAALQAELERIRADGPDKARFERLRRSHCGTLLTGFDSFDYLARELAAGCFRGWLPHDAFETLETLTPDDAVSYLAAAFAPGRTALSLVEPQK